MKKIVLAKNAGFCFGVKRAVDKALDTQNYYNKKIYTLGPLIHNKDVVGYLEKNNIFPIELKEINKLLPNDVIVIRSHGITPDILNTLKEKKIIIEDATCPHVSKIHKKVNEYKELGYKIIIVGDKLHPEVVGINGWAGNNALVTKTGDELYKLSKEDKFCVVSQTTERKENWERVLKTLNELKLEFISFNTICSATSVRQNSVSELAKNVDLMVVIGARHSSNTTKLYEICKVNCKNTIHVENAGEIPDKILNSKNIINIGVTAGASTPDWIIKEAINKMSDNKAQDVNEQLNFMNQNDINIAIGDIISGEIISMSGKEAFINIGYKKDGKLPIKEVTRDEEVKMTELFNLNEEITAKVISLGDSDGYVVLSRIEIERDSAYIELEEAFRNKDIVNIELVEAVKGGIISRFKGIRIFLPASHVELFHVEDLGEYIGKSFDVNIIEYKKERKGTKIVASRRDILTRAKVKKAEDSWNSFEVGQIHQGIIKRITKFGAFIEVNGVDGLLHVSEISWGRVENPSDVLKVNEKINVYLLNVDKDAKKLSLSIKKIMPNPWDTVVEKYPVGTIALGKIVRFSNFGAFVELEPGVDGLVHISEISHKRIEKPSDELQIGEAVKVKILNVNSDSKKIGLSIKEAEEI